MIKKKKPSTHILSDHQDLEILKTVAQAWHAHSGSSSSSTSDNLTDDEYNAHRRNFEYKPSRFKREAMKLYNPSSASASASSSIANWDFRQSLLDSYEIVAVTKKLERGLDLDKADLFSYTSSHDYKNRVNRRRKESKNSLRNLFNLMSSRRFSESEIPR